MRDGCNLNSSRRGVNIPHLRPRGGELTPEGPRHAALPLRSFAVRRLLVTVVLALGLGVGCMGGESPAIEQSELKAIVLQPEDLGRAFLRFDEGRQATADRPAGARNDPTRFGREEGWKARYRRSGSPSTRGALVVESRADLFGDADGARDELEAHRRELGEGLRATGDAPELGDDAFVATGTQGAGRFAVRFYLVVWRDENAAASILANGFEGRFTAEDALGLARKQQARIEAAS